MAIALDKAYKAKKDIVVTGWSPHWMFSKYHLKYLADPKETMGKGAKIFKPLHVKALKQDNPKLGKVLDKFHWTKDDMESVMLAIQNGKSPKAAAADWLKSHKKLADSWYD